MEFSTMSTREVREHTERVCKALNESSTFTEAYYRIHGDNTPVIYAKVTAHSLPLAGSGIRVTIRVEEIERIANALSF